MSISGVTRELLVRYLDTWAPSVLHSARGATFVQAWSGPADVAAAEAALRVFAEFADRLRRRRLAVVLVAPNTDELRRRADLVLEELSTPQELSVHPVDGFDRLLAAIKAAGVAGAPLLSYVDTGSHSGSAVDLSALGKGKPSEVFLAGPAGEWLARRQALQDAGFPLSAGVELVEADAQVLLAFGTTSARSLEVFKNELWSVDEYAGVRYRDPQDPQGQLMDISFDPNPGTLRRELLAHLRERPRTVTELKRFALTETIYRATDAVKVVTALLRAGTVRRSPEGGRLGGDVIIAL